MNPFISPASSLAIQSMGINLDTAIRRAAAPSYGFRASTAMEITHGAPPSQFAINSKDSALCQINKAIFNSATSDTFGMHEYKSSADAAANAIGNNYNMRNSLNKIHEHCVKDVNSLNGLNATQQSMIGATIITPDMIMGLK